MHQVGAIPGLVTLSDPTKQRRAQRSESFTSSPELLGRSDGLVGCRTSPWTSWCRQMCKLSVERGYRACIGVLDRSMMRDDLAT